MYFSCTKLSFIVICAFTLSPTNIVVNILLLLWYKLVSITLNDSKYYVHRVYNFNTVHLKA